MKSNRYRDAVQVVQGLTLLFTALACVAASGQGSRISPKDRAKWRLAQHAAAQRVLENIATLSRGAALDMVVLTGDLTETMQRNVASHQNRAKSRGLCEKNIRDARKNTFESQLNKAVAAAQEHSPLPVKQSDVLKKVDADWNALVDDAISAFVTNYSGQIFTNARSRAVAVQRQQIDMRTRYPAKNEINTMLTEMTSKLTDDRTRLSRDDLSALRDRLKPFAGEDKSVVFDEVQRYIENVGSKMANEISNQYEKQLEVLDKNLANQNELFNLLTAKRISSRLTERVDKYVINEEKERRQADPGSTNVPVYGVFEVVHSNITVAALQTEDEGFSAYLSSLTMNTISPTDLKQRINNQLKRHKMAGKSEAVFLAEYRESLRERTAADYVAKANIPASLSKKDTTTRFMNMLEGHTKASKTYDQQITKRIKALLPDIRKEIAEKQFTSHFPDLTSERTLTSKTVEYLHDKKQFKPLGSVSEVMEILRVDNQLMMPDPAKLSLLEETDKMVVDHANRLIDQARDAFDSQMALVRELEKRKLDRLQRDVAKNRPFAKILAEWTSDLEKSWKKHVRARKSPFRSLFDRTRDALNKTVRQLYDTCRQKQETTQLAGESTLSTKSAAKDTSKKGDEYIESTSISSPSARREDTSQEKEDQTDGEGKGTTEQEAIWDQHPDCAIILADAEKNLCEAILKSAETGTVVNIKFDPAEIEKASGDIFTGIQEEIQEILSAKNNKRPGRRFFFFITAKQEPKLKVVVIVKSVLVRHMTSILLRQSIEAQLEEWSSSHPDSPPIELIWKVGL